MDRAIGGLVQRKVEEWLHHVNTSPFPKLKALDALESLKDVVQRTQYDPDNTRVVTSGIQGQVALTLDAVHGTRLAVKMSTAQVCKQDTEHALLMTSVGQELSLAICALNPEACTPELLQALQGLVVATGAKVDVTPSGELTLTTIYPQWDGTLSELACSSIKGIPWSGWNAHHHDMKPVPVYHVIKLLSQVCGKLDNIHQAKLLYTDLKPDNILIRLTAGAEVEAAFGDVGSLVLTHATTGMNASRYLMTAMYRPPADDNAACDASFDVWSLAPVALHLLFGTGHLGTDSSAIKQVWLQACKTPLADRVHYLLASGAMSNLQPRLECVMAQEAWTVAGCDVLTIIAELIDPTAACIPTAGAAKARLDALAAKIEAHTARPEQLILNLPGHLFQDNAVYAPPVSPPISTPSSVSGLPGPAAVTAPLQLSSVAQSLGAPYVHSSVSSAIQADSLDTHSNALSPAGPTQPSSADIHRSVPAAVQPDSEGALSCSTVDAVITSLFKTQLTGLLQHDQATSELSNRLVLMPSRLTGSTPVPFLMSKAYGTCLADVHSPAVQVTIMDESFLDSPHGSVTGDVDAQGQVTEVAEVDVEVEASGTAQEPVPVTSPVLAGQPKDDAVLISPVSRWQGLNACLHKRWKRVKEGAVQLASKVLGVISTLLTTQLVITIDW